MKMALGHIEKDCFKGGGDTHIAIKDADNVQFAVLKSWNKLRWDKKSQMLIGTADMELLDRLASIVQLPPAIAQRRSQLHRVQEAIDSERVNPHPKPLADYPVKMSLYDHQVRGANMCLVAFGWANPDAIERRNGSHALSCHYVDRVGFQQISGFLPDNPLKNAEMTVSADADRGSGNPILCRSR